MNKDHGLQFKSFVPSLITCLGDANTSVSHAAMIAIIELFRYPWFKPFFQLTLILRPGILQTGPKLMYENI